MDNKKHEGLTTKEALKLLSIHGENKIDDAKKATLFTLLISQYTNVISLILILAFLFSFFIKEFVDAGFIMFVLVVNGLFSFLQEYRAENTLTKLKKLIVSIAKVVRDGTQQALDAKYLVPSDICIIEEGDRIPADGTLVTSVALEIDESLFSGESLPIDKKNQDKLFSGTFVVKGRGRMLVEKTGQATRLGEIAYEIKKTTKPRTPLSDNLDHLGKRLSILAILMSLFLIPIGISQGRELKQLVLTVVSLSVAVIPEGLPLVVTIALAVGAYRMVKEKTIVRKMAAIETLGATTVILSDKTGTLTQNTMSVKKYWIEKEQNLQLLLRACVLGNTASIILKENKQGFEVVGNKTDGALLSFAKNNVKDLEKFQNQGKLLMEKPFDRVSKSIEITWEVKNNIYEFVRGAPESIFQILSIKDVSKIEKEFMKLATEGLRIIAFAYKEKNQNNFKFLGFIGIYDPPRTEAHQTLLDAKRAGIRVVMVTGDHSKTALSVAEEVGLIEKDELVLDADEIQKLSDEELLRLLPRVRIFARMKPSDKKRLVLLYRKAGFIVAVTGDGVNDALALSESHIGVAMGEQGTDVAKEASDIIITDDNLATIIKAIEEGRNIFDNITKTVIFLLSSNIAEFMIISLSIILNLPIPLSPTQILWINLVSDGIPALALATDTKRKNILNLKPRNVSEGILTRERMSFIIKIAIPFSFSLVLFYYLSLFFVTYLFAKIILFNVMVVGEFIILFFVRGGVTPFNKFLIGSVIVILILQAIIFFNPFLRSLLS